MSRKMNYKSTRNRDTYRDSINEILNTSNKKKEYSIKPKDFKCKKCNSKILVNKIAKPPHNYIIECGNGHYYKFSSKPIEIIKKTVNKSFLI